MNEYHCRSPNKTFPSGLLGISYRYVYTRSGHKLIEYEGISLGLPKITKFWKLLPMIRYLLWSASKMNSTMSLGFPNVIMKSTNTFRTAIYEKLLQILVLMSGSIK